MNRREMLKAVAATPLLGCFAVGGAKEIVEERYPTEESYQLIVRDGGNKYWHVSSSPKRFRRTTINKHLAEEILKKQFGSDDSVVVQLRPGGLVYWSGNQSILSKVTFWDTKGTLPCRPKN